MPSSADRFSSNETSGGAGPTPGPEQALPPYQRRFAGGQALSCRLDGRCAARGVAARGDVFDPGGEPPSTQFVNSISAGSAAWFAASCVL